MPLLTVSTGAPNSTVYNECLFCLLFLLTKSLRNNDYAYINVNFHGCIQKIRIKTEQKREKKANKKINFLADVYYTKIHTYTHLSIKEND